MEAQKLPEGWIDICSDVIWENFGGYWGFSSASDNSWWIVQFTNMYDAVGEDECKRDGAHEFSASITRVVLSELPPKQIEGICSSGDIDWATVSDAQKAYATVSYGLGAPMGTMSGDVTEGEEHDAAAARIRQMAFDFVAHLVSDPAHVEAMLDRVVNKIGTTAREYGAGDFDAGLRRYACGEGETDPAKDIILKIQGAPTREVIEFLAQNQEKAEIALQHTTAKLLDENPGLSHDEASKKAAAMIVAAATKELARRKEAAEHEIQFGTLHADGTLHDVRMIKKSDIDKCRFKIIVPEHYRDDGTCKCDDADHRKVMIEEWGYKKSSFTGIPIRGKA